MSLKVIKASDIFEEKTAAFHVLELLESNYFLGRIGKNILDMKKCIFSPINGRVRVAKVQLSKISMLVHMGVNPKQFIEKARKYSLVPKGFLTVQFRNCVDSQDKKTTQMPPFVRPMI